jgi:hypothetical protein
MLQGLMNAVGGVASNLDLIPFVRKAHRDQQLKQLTRVVWKGYLVIRGNQRYLLLKILKNKLFLNFVSEINPNFIKIKKTLTELRVYKSVFELIP